ncbi:MAG: ABC transporter ATP-binding protein [SAR202 cluster bacterium]|nr:sulfonate ABC transporter ATP-binding protein [Chloroflexota bacterium]MQG59229.1 ABC transporter ATP-binding protein [SAR202 cluster bacterium]MQG69426.1 ABC transporter ATP-binding protein [SAR202 cluster bacterium]HAL48181.1 sulfonate ABC transporter ATP-binding protein [Dehalococcoidia bacterium]
MNVKEQSEASPHVQLADVSRSFSTGADTLEALDNVTLDVGQGEFVCLLGPSGCGKSTLLRIVGGLLEPTSGSVAVGRRTPAEAQAEKELGFVFQEPSLLPWRSASDNIRLPLEVNRANGGDSGRSVEDLLNVVGLDRFGHYYPSQLSGGMQQRVALARALVFDPSLLLMDEPFGALDEITRAMMRYELLRIWDEDQKTVVFVTHSIPEAIVLSDRVAVLSDRPGHVRSIVPIDLPRPRTELMERSRVFLTYSEQLHDLLLPGGGDG